jgi:tetrahydromethanopterin S-methyltransferase subunit G
MYGPRKGENLMSDEAKKPQESSPVLEMPWVLISNQIQQLNTSLNERFNDVNARFGDLKTRMDDMNTNLSRRIEEVNTNLAKRIEDVNTHLNHRMDGLDKRMDGVEARLTHRLSIWITIVLAALTALLGFLFAHVRF